MRIDLPCCPLKTCRYYSNGNCTNKTSTYETCEFTNQQAEIGKLERTVSHLEDYCNSIPDKVRAEAIKDFAEKLENRFFSYYEVLNKDSSKSNYRGETLMVYEVADMIKDCIASTVEEMKGGAADAT